MARDTRPARAPANQSRAMTTTEANAQNLTRVVDMVAKKRDQLAMLLAGSMDPERFITVALAAVQGTPKLAECSALSIFASIREAAVYGLELGPLGDASLVPYDGEATLSVEYRGYRKLAMRDGSVRVIAADVVYEADAFRIVSGSDPALFHEPALGDRGNVIGAYAWARLANGELVYVWMTEAELYKRRDVSRSWRTAIKYGRTDSIWHLWPVEMMRKTVIKRLCSEQLPLTPLVREAITRDTDADLARQEERTRLEPGALQGGDARQRILAAMGVDRPALEPGATPAQEERPPTPAADPETGEVVQGDAGDQEPPPPTEAPAADVPECASPSPWEDVPESCTKPLGHRMVCSNGRATWETPKGWGEQ